MQSKLLVEENKLKTFALAFDKNDDVLPLLLQFAEENNISSARLSGIGAFQRVRLGYFDRERREYQPIEINEQVELLSFVGNLARSDGKAKLHAHVIVGKRDGTAHGGHLLGGSVWPTMEVMVIETPAYLRRTMDESTGLALLDLAA
ncbi:MAG TPA: PPC domain-containing DNA-binding protein [Terriglobales bacterium]|nr:PPC domain-containing DNA-binding protein [Terriglobales bacterium]